MQDEMRRASRYDFAETTRRLPELIQAHGSTLSARVDHAAAAATVGLSLRPTEVFIFGNPAVGTKLMLLSDTVGLDLPLRILVTADEQGTCWLVYSDPVALAKRHALPDATTAVLHAMGDGLAAIVDALAKQEPLQRRTRGSGPGLGTVLSPLKRLLRRRAAFLRPLFARDSHARSGRCCQANRAGCLLERGSSISP